jgi:predicted PolB exonuclease-like 3'-5' exonuclease
LRSKELNMGWPVLVFDIETIPDVAGMRAVGLGQSAETSALPAGVDTRDADAQTWGAWQAERVAQGKSDIMPLHLQRILVISACSATPRGCACTRLWTGTARVKGKVIQTFFNTIEKHVPQLVSWNGGGFDLPVLHYRGLKHGVVADKYWDLGDDDREFKWNNYISRYHMRHLDLMDLLAMYQPKNNAPLDAMAKLCGFPGKLGMDGSQVYPAYLDGKLDEIRRYCETDVMNTYLLYCRFQKMRGGERKSRYVADMKVCLVLAPQVSAMLVPLRRLIESMDAVETLAQIELAMGDLPTNGEGSSAVIAMVLRHLEPLSVGDLGRLRQFAALNPGLQWWLQPKGPETIHRLDELPGHETGQLAYALPDFGITMPFRPTDFTQVNPHINRVLVSRALGLLKVQRDERVIDWFCGLGNFTLPLATQAREVLGVEGAESLVARSRENLKLNQAVAHVTHALAATKFVARNLFEMTPELLVGDGSADKWLVDPPREGAFALVLALAGVRQRVCGRPDWPLRPN